MTLDIGGWNGIGILAALAILAGGILLAVYAVRRGLVQRDLDGTIETEGRRGHVAGQRGRGRGAVAEAGTRRGHAPRRGHRAGCRRGAHFASRPDRGGPGQPADRLRPGVGRLPPGHREPAGVANAVARRPTPGATMAPMPRSSDTLSAAACAFLDAVRFASVATTDDDGAPRQTVVWYRLQGDGRILLNGRLPRRWCANLLRDPRVAISVIDAADGYRWLGITGVVDQVVDDLGPARDHIVELAHRYHPEGPDEALIAEFRTQQRITYLVRVTGVHDHLED